MTSVSVLFYGRRTRLGRSTSDPDDLGFLSSSSFSDRPHDTNPCHRHRSNPRNAGGTSSRGRSDRRRLHHRSDQHNRHVTTGEFDESGMSSCYRRLPCSEATAPETVPIQQFDCEGVIEAPIQNIFHGDTLDSIRSRFNSNERLPRSVLLARERLVQRLSGVSVSSVRQSGHTIQASHFDNYWLNDSGNGPSNLVENRFITDSTSPATRHLHVAISDPEALEREALASLHHEVFTEVTDIDSNQKFSVSEECSICLEWFTEGNELISLQCGHRFHSCCLSPWVQTCMKCPYCRSEISSH